MARVTANSKTQATLGRPKEKLNEMIQKKAFELYQKRGGVSGSAWTDWFEAERLIKDEVKK